ncbi:citrulline utilization hydrolase CtlX [Phaeobacter inhibens]|uniref:citrulline utilization hydrolase CtlX n=1 Tax=Phaeobacter inhibens TaxID=221822 RepID=UPI00076BB40B|nr:arginine deiminase-related protein [Phaeobacter inhibens]KXF89709.1 amidinotransferase [Phaeobacter inhibens]WHP70287.1 arginine deiminase-related protein [Phaeobacter inhibens]
MSQLQAPGAVVMIRPHHFCSNPETRDDNAFQTLANDTADVTSAQALVEFDAAVAALRGAGVSVHVFDNKGTETPDSVFPNNWFSTHAGGHVAVYPMYAANRRKERRWDVIELLKRDYRVQDVIDYSGLEQDGLALEGTGAMVLDHIGRIAYTVKSNRADPVLLERFCTHFNFEPMVFEARDAQGRDVYHTNVLMGIGTDYALICLDMITNPTRRAEVAARLEETGRRVIDLTPEQIAGFAGNALELTGDRRLLALSSCAVEVLRPEQIAIVERSADLLPLSIPTIETAGGSVRCMLAAIHLSPRERTQL